MQTPDILTRIASFLDHRSLARMSRTSKENAALLKPEVARYHSLKHAAQLIIDERIRTPTDVYSAWTIEGDGCMIRYFTNKAAGPMALFTVAVDLASHSISVSSQIGYAIKHPNMGFSQLIFFHSVTIQTHCKEDVQPASIIQQCPIA